MALTETTQESSLQHIRSMIDAGNLDGAYAALKRVYTECLAEGVEAGQGFRDLHLLAIAKEQACKT